MLCLNLHELSHVQRQGNPLRFLRGYEFTRIKLVVIIQLQFLITFVDLVELS